MNNLIERSYRIGNELDRIADIVGDIIAVTRPQRHFGGQMEVALYEALYNAIEHGNLALSFTEKKRLIECGRYDEFIAERRALKPYADRAVTVLLQVTPERLIITVSDEGDGFDWRAHLGPKDDDESALLDVNGRGITIMQSAFDTVRYNDPGNTVTLIKERESA